MQRGKCPAFEKIKNSHLNRHPLGISGGYIRQAYALAMNLII